MTRESRERWETEIFRTDVQPWLDGLFGQRRCEGPVDLRGMSVGAGSPVPELRSVNFAGCELSRVDLSDGVFSASFAGAVLREVSFARAELQGCNFGKARVHGCGFEGAALVATFDDALFEGCGFEGASIGSRGRRLVLEFGGRRATFERCTFRGCRIQGVMLRASRFRECIFDTCELERCDLRGVRFEGCTFTDTRVLRSSIQGVRFPEPGPTRVDCEE